MKRALFTTGSIFILISAVFFSCTKTNPYAASGNGVVAGNGVGYANSPGQGFGTGTNPYPNGSPSTSTVTQPSTSTSTGGSTMIVNGANGSSVSASGGVSGSNYVVTHTSNLASVIITFGVSTIPPSGNYSIVTSAPTASQCKFALGSGGNAASGVVSVTAGTPNTATYSNIIVGTITLTGVAKY